MTNLVALGLMVSDKKIFKDFKKFSVLLPLNGSVATPKNDHFPKFKFKNSQNERFSLLRPKIEDKGMNLLSAIVWNSHSYTV